MECKEIVRTFLSSFRLVLHNVSGIPATLWLTMRTECEEFVSLNEDAYYLLFLLGQERFTWMTRVYYRDARGCIIMFDLTNRKSFQNITRWKNDLDSKVWLPDGSNIPCLLLANKVISFIFQMDLGLRN